MSGLSVVNIDYAEATKWASTVGGMIAAPGADATGMPHPKPEACALPRVAVYGNMYV